MLVYTATKSEFSKDVISNTIEEKILEMFERKLGHSTQESEIRSWKNSMMYMNNVLSDKAIPGNAGVSIEYKIPQTNNRIDFILTGKGEKHNDTAIIIELKQWSDVKRTGKDGIVSTFISKATRETNHPSYQAWTYAALLYDFNETVREEGIELQPCAYLHNCEAEDVINHSFYDEHTRNAPAFLKHDVERLQAFIKRYVRYGDTDDIMYRIDHGKIKPSKNLADTLVSLLKGKQEFLMIDDQKLVFETVVSLAEKSTENDKHVLIVEGGPGTGKSVVAINLLVELTRREMTAQYVTKNAAPREVYAAKLKGTFRKSQIDNLFKSSGAYVKAEPNTFDALVVDEAHRLNAKSGMFHNIGESQIKEIIEASKHSVFFIDEDQRISFKDVGEKIEIREWARQLGARVHELELKSQFRCNGSDGYLAWLDDVLQVRDTANQTLEGIDYDFRVFDSPSELRDAIYARNRVNNKARLVAGYCWDWVSKNDSRLDDIVIPESQAQRVPFSMKWNLATDGKLWVIKESSVKEVGCIHTCQGLEVDYVGVIIGPDLIVRDGEIVTDAAMRSGMDSTVKGYKKQLKEDSAAARARAEMIIKNTYRTLMTRGQKGCYLYCTDEETREYFRARIEGRLHEAQEAAGRSQAAQNAHGNNGIPFRVLPPDEVRPFENSLPLYDLEVAAGAFSEEQSVPDGGQIGGVYDLDGTKWVEPPESVRIQPGYFIAKVVGESMNRRIPNGSWCLFKLNPGGSRQGKVVLVQHRDISDLETGGHYTVKVYESEKVNGEDGGWQHSRITLRPDSLFPDYEAIVLEGGDVEGLRVVAEWMGVVGWA